MFLDLLRVISHHRAKLATPIRTVQKINSEADLENVPFSDTIFTRSGATANRPLLLIEPSYKINGEDKVKASNRSLHANEEKDVKVDEAAPVSELKADTKAGSMPVDSKRDKVIAKSTSDLSTNSKVLAVSDSECITSNGAAPEGSSVSYTESGSERTENPVISQTKQDIERSVASPLMTTPSLEENIVLGVALEGSKRTLPIEEEMDSSPSPLESKELAARRNGGSSPSGKDKNESRDSF